MSTGDRVEHISTGQTGVISAQKRGFSYVRWGDKTHGWYPNSVLKVI